MHINPIYRKELKLSTRSLKLPMLFMIYIILLTGSACFACTAFFNSYNYYQSQYSSILTVFICLSVAEVVMVMLEVPAFTANAIAGERERQTLDILLTTNLKPVQIVLGKLLSSLSSLFLLTLLSLPVLGITFAIGGIHLKDLLQLFFFILICMFFIGSLGIFFSAVLKRTSGATVASYASLLFITAGTMILLLLVVWAAEVRASNLRVETGVYTPINLGILPMIFLANPAVTMFYMMASNYYSKAVITEFFEFFGFRYTPIIDHWFELSIIVQILLGVLFLFLATKKIDPLNEKKPRKKIKVKLRFF